MTTTVTLAAHARRGLTTVTLAAQCHHAARVAYLVKPVAYLVKPVAYLVKQVLCSQKVAFDHYVQYAEQGTERSSEWSNSAMEIGLLQSAKPCLKAYLCLHVWF